MNNQRLKTSQFKIHQITRSVFVKIENEKKKLFGITPSI